MEASAPPRPSPAQPTFAHLEIKFDRPQPPKASVAQVHGEPGHRWHWLVAAEGENFSGFHAVFAHAPPVATAGFAFQHGIKPVFVEGTGKWTIMDAGGRALRQDRPHSRAVAAAGDSDSSTLHLLLRGDGTLPQDAVPRAVENANALLRAHADASVVLLPMGKAAFDFAWQAATSGVHGAASPEYIIVHLPTACCNCGKIEGLGCTCVAGRKKNVAPLLFCDRCKQLPKGHPPEHLCGYSASAGRGRGWAHGGCYATWDARRKLTATPGPPNPWLTVCKAECTQPGMCRVAPNPFCAPVSSQRAALDPWAGAWCPGEYWRNSLK